MLFNTLRFLLVFPFLFCLYWAIPARYNQWRKGFLILASYLLYMNWKPAYALVLLGVTLITYWGGQFLEFGENDEESKLKCKKRLVWLFVLMGVLPLLVFKYYNFLNNNVREGLAAIGLQFSMPGLNWAVPVGISFFTLH